MLVPYIAGTHITYDQNTPYFSGQCDVAKVTVSDFEYANSIFCLKNGIFEIHRSQKFKIMSIHTEYIKIHQRQFV